MQEEARPRLHPSLQLCGERGGEENLGVKRLTLVGHAHSSPNIHALSWFRSVLGSEPTEGSQMLL